MSVEKINSPKNDYNESSRKPPEQVVVENGQGDGKDKQDLEGSQQNSEEKSAENHVSAGADTGDAEASDTIEENSVKTSKMQYSLSAVICYIDDKSNEDRRNIVALLRVGPSYHERSAGSAVSQWYIFNDFWYVTCLFHLLINGNY